MQIINSTSTFTEKSYFKVLIYVLLISVSVSRETAFTFEYYVSAGGGLEKKETDRKTVNN